MAENRNFGVALKLAISAALLAQGSLSQRIDRSNVNINDRVFLTAAQPEAGQVQYIEIYEHLGKVDYLLEDGDWVPLITGLIYPTHITYDFGSGMLYVCDCDKIRQYSIDFVNTNGEDIIYSIEKGNIVEGIMCGGLSMDKFHNLHYVDRTSNEINRINRDLLMTEKYPVDLKVQLYSSSETSSVNSVTDVDIENEYLYWAQDSHNSGHGGVHKAFTVPFIKAEPF